jgi:low temperature requirement protein LtrA
VQAAAVRVSDALAERFGLFIIIVLGETLTGVVAGLVRRPVSGLALSVGLIAAVVGFGAWWTYFDFAGHRQPRSGRWPSLQWMLGHLPLTAAIAAMGAAMVSLVDHAAAARAPAGTAWVLCTGAAVVLVATVFVAVSQPGWHEKRELYRPVGWACAAAALGCFAVALIRPVPLLVDLALVVLFSIPWGLAVTRRLTSLQATEHDAGAAG